MSNIITSLQIQKKNKERVNIFLNEKYAFAVTLMAATKLKKGQALSDAEIATLKHEDQGNKAYDAALRYLGNRPRSEAEIAKYLAGKEVDEETITVIINRLKEFGYLNDQAFSQYWTENRLQFRPKGARALRFELRQKGVDNATIDGALEELDEESAAWNAIEKKLSRWQALEPVEFEKKLKGFLLRRGFDYEVVNAIWKRAQED